MRPAVQVDDVADVPNDSVPCNPGTNPDHPPAAAAVFVPFHRQLFPIKPQRMECKALSY